MTLARKEAPASRSSEGSTDTGLGSAEIKVKGKRATKKQRDTIEGCLNQAADDSASQRVMVAIVMCITQESGAGQLAGVMTGDDDVGIYQQGRNWISEEGSKDPGQSTHAFLITGPTSWKKVHGGVKKAPGNLSHAIHAVQNNRDPNAYAQWENEASETVAAFHGGDGGGGSYTKRYEFSRGEQHGAKENSWDAMARLVGEVDAYRWASQNVLHAVSGDELRQQKASLTIRGDEGWLLKAPAWSWANNRAVVEVTLEVLWEHWDLAPGALVVMYDEFGVIAGRYMVWNISGASLESPEMTVVLRRPTRLKSEPPSETAERSTDGGGGGGDLYQAAKEISDEKHSYPHPKVHHGVWKNIKSNTPLDCSESTSLALHNAGLFDHPQAWVSGQFATSYGSKGKGDEWTIWANDGHVWIEFYTSSGAFKARFDTSQHPESGPRLVTTPRSDQGRFTGRHSG